MFSFIAIGQARAASPRFARFQVLRLASLRARIAAVTAREREAFPAVPDATDDELVRLNALHVTNALEHVRWDARVGLRHGRIR